MVNEYNYISIKEILSRLLRHPLLQDVSLEQALQYTLDFIGTFGYSKMYENQEAIVEIKDYKGLLPCNLISIIQVKDMNTDKCLRSMTDSFHTKNNSTGDNPFMVQDDYSFKTQGRIIYTSFKEGKVNISYKAIHVDKDGLPMLIDNATYLKALESYIKKEVFTILFDMNKISANVLTNTQQDYAWRAGQLQAEMNIPSYSEMESIKNMWTTLLQSNTHFKDGFRNLGSQEYIKVK